MGYFRRKTFILLLLLIASLPVSVLAGPGRTGAQILNLGSGARARALGDAFYAMSGDVTTALWNPSGLADIPESKFRSGQKAVQTSMSYTDFGTRFGEAIGELYYAFLSGAVPLDDLGTIGATLQIQEQGTLQIPGQGTKSLGTNFALTLSYANWITESLSAGINGKIIRMVLGSESGSSYAVDFGTQYHLPFEPAPTTIGVAIQNIGPGISFIDENQADPLPRLLRVGTSISLYRDKYNDLRFVSGVTAYVDKLTENEDELAVDLERLNAERAEKLTREQLLSDRGVGVRAFEWRHLQKNVGLEYWFYDMLALRVGYKIEPSVNVPQAGWFSFLPDWININNFTGGIGVKIYPFNLDLSYRANPGPDWTPISGLRELISGDFISTLPGSIELTGRMIF